MANPQKRKGDLFENEIVKYLQGAGWPEACRSRAGWSDDKGDLEGLKFTFECKNHRGDSLPTWIRELEVEQRTPKPILVRSSTRSNVRLIPANNSQPCP